MSLRGQSSGDFKETSGRVQLFHVVTRNSVGIASTDAFTQANPPVVTAGANKSTTLSTITKVGVLGGSVAFTRPDVGNNIYGGPVAPGGVYNGSFRPLGIFLNDAVGNAFENTPGVASGRAPFVCGSGSCVGVTVYETQQQIGGSTTLTWANGDKVYASVNGLLTNLSGDAYEFQASGTPAPTLMGIVRAAPDATNPMLVVDLRV